MEKKMNNAGMKSERRAQRMVLGLAAAALVAVSYGIAVVLGGFWVALSPESLGTEGVAMAWALRLAACCAFLALHLVMQKVVLILGTTDLLLQREMRHLMARYHDVHNRACPQIANLFLGLGVRPWWRRLTSELAIEALRESWRTWVQKGGLHAEIG